VRGFRNGSRGATVRRGVGLTGGVRVMGRLFGFAVLLGLVVAGAAPAAADDTASDLAVSAVVDLTGGPVIVGTTHVQRATVVDHGPADARNVKVTVTASAGQRLVAHPHPAYTCTSNLAKSVLTCTFPLMATVVDIGYPLTWDATFTTATAKTATVKISSTNPDPDLTNNTAVLGTPKLTTDLNVVQVFDSTGGGAEAGGVHEQGAVIGNQGPDSATDVKVTVTVSAGQKIDAEESPSFTCSANYSHTALTCTIANVANGATYPLNWHVTYTTGTAKTVTVKVPLVNDPDTSDNTGVITTPGPVSDLELGAVVDLTGGPVVLGVTHTQEVPLTNNGPNATTTSTLTVTASAGQRLACVPGAGYSCLSNIAKTGLTYTFKGLGTGESRTATWSVTYTTATDKTVTATVSGSSSDPAPANNTSVLHSFVGG
jgi:hypothetical protein